MMSTFSGTHIEVPLIEVVDGDTIKVELPGGAIENIRILGLDTEEKPGSGGNKPKTPWGQKATERATSFFANAPTVTLEFPGTESVAVSLQKYRGNFGRVLAFVHLNEQDFQEVMIREGYSPYFSKYGYANFPVLHQRYLTAERAAQMAHIGVWNQLAVNGEERRNYASLSTWWTLRASLIDNYRSYLANGKTIYNTRLDYPLILEKARQRKTVTLFTEVRSLRTIHNDSIGFVDIGSSFQRFTLFLPGLNSNDGMKLRNLLEQRYIASDEENNHLRRSYLYVTGELSLFNDDPQMIVTNVAQITDDFPINPISPRPVKNVAIVAALPDPVGADSGHETVTLKNLDTASLSVSGWKLRDRTNNEMVLPDLTIAAGASEEITVQGRLSLNNNGDEIKLLNPQDTVIDQVSYTKQDVVPGQPLFF